MATLTKKGASWYLRFSVDGRHTARSLGRVSEDEARKALVAFAIGRLPRGSVRNKASRPLTDGELYELHRKSLERARERGIEHALSLHDVRDLYARSKGRCEVSGIEFDRNKPEGATRRPWYPSIDRIDSRGHYRAENCRLVCVAVNIAMCEWGVGTLTRLSRALVLGPLAAEDHEPGTNEKILPQ